MSEKNHRSLIAAWLTYVSGSYSSTFVLCTSLAVCRSLLESVSGMEHRFGAQYLAAYDVIAAHTWAILSPALSLIGIVVLLLYIFYPVFFLFLSSLLFFFLVFFSFLLSFFFSIFLYLFAFLMIVLSFAAFGSDVFPFLVNKTSNKSAFCSSHQSCLSSSQQIFTYCVAKIFVNFCALVRCLLRP